MKSAISGEYVIQQKEDGGIEVYRIFDNVKGSLREASETVGFEYEEKWNTRTFGSKLCKEFGNGKEAQVGNFFIKVLESGSIETYRSYDNTKGTLREIADSVGFDVDPKWTTRQLGSKLIDEISSK